MKYNSIQNSSMPEKHRRFLLKERFVSACIMLFLHLCAAGQPLSGTYTIGNVSSDFLTIHDAISHMEQSGISGPVIFNLLPGTYRETNEIMQIPGSVSFVITFESSTGKSNDVVIQDSVTNPNNALIKIDSYGIANEREF